MQWFRRVISVRTAGTDLLRLVVCGILFAHGAFRFYSGEVPGLGELLTERHVPAGMPIAYAITVAETLGTALMAARVAVWPVCGFLSVVYFVAILMFNLRHGFFLVGAGEGGWEYNALLITCLLTTAWENRASRVY